MYRSGREHRTKMYCKQVGTYLESTSARCVSQDGMTYQITNSTCEAGYLLQEVPRDRGGLAPMGPAAKKDWSAAVGKMWHTPSHACQTPDQRSVSHPLHSKLAAASRGWQRQTQSMADADNGGNVEAKRRTRGSAL